MFLILFALGFLSFYLYFVFMTPHWDKFNIPYLKPNPFFGNLVDVVLQRATFPQIYKQIYEKFKNSAYVGIYIIRRPAILVRDVKLAKEILIKDFPSFHDNDLEVNSDLDPIFGNNPFTTKGKKWKKQRSQHTPLFTTRKVKSMVKAVKENSNKMVKYISEQITKNNCLEAMDISAKYTISNVGSCALGINNRTFEEPNSEMRQMGRDFVELNSFFNSLKQILMTLIPSLFDFFGVTLVPVKVYKRFKQIVVDQLNYRKQNNIVRNDFFDNARMVKGKESPVLDVIAQVGGFFVDAFGTSAHALNFTLYEVAKNTAVQETLRKEVEDTLAKNNGNITYDILNEMPYLEGIVLESLRMYPTLGSMTRLCTAPYTLPPATLTSDPIKVEVGTPIVIPILGIHYDEKYFKNPNVFDPTRFLPENRAHIDKSAYLAFGDGPRVCIGKKFALMQAKMCLVKLVENFEMRVNPKTRDPIVLHPGAVLMSAKDGIWLDITKRTN